MSKEDIKFLCFAFLPLFIIVWIAHILLFGIGKATIIILAMIGSFAIGISWLSFITNWWFKHRK